MSDDDDDINKDYEALKEALASAGKGMVIPTIVYGDGLTPEQTAEVASILEAIDRAQIVAMTLAQKGEDSPEMEEWEPLRRVVTGIADASLLPIVKVVLEGGDFGAAMNAMRHVLAGLGAMMFIAGTKYQHQMSLPEEERSPVQPLREKLPDLPAEQKAEMHDLFARLREEYDPQEG